MRPAPSGSRPFSHRAGAQDREGESK
jgi:hypothetical protein